jgi:hypothetical protein
MIHLRRNGEGKSVFQRNDSSADSVDDIFARNEEDEKLGRSE